jgi:hypothetical protein
VFLYSVYAHIGRRLGTSANHQHLLLPPYNTNSTDKASAAVSFEYAKDAGLSSELFDIEMINIHSTDSDRDHRGLAANDVEVGRSFTFRLGFFVKYIKHSRLYERL